MRSERTTAMCWTAGALVALALSHVAMGVWSAGLEGAAAGLVLGAPCIGLAALTWFHGWTRGRLVLLWVTGGLLVGITLLEARVLYGLWGSALGWFGRGLVGTILIVGSFALVLLTWLILWIVQPRKDEPLW